MPAFLLDDDEMFALCGYRQKRKQIEALVKMDVPFVLPPDGKPRVLRRTVEGPVDDEAPRRRQGPRLEGLAKR